MFGITTDHQKLISTSNKTTFLTYACQTGAYFQKEVFFFFSVFKPCIGFFFSTKSILKRFFILLFGSGFFRYRFGTRAIGRTFVTSIPINNATAC